LYENGLYDYKKMTWRMAWNCSTTSDSCFSQSCV